MDGLKEIKERLEKVFKHLYSIGAVRSQREFADKLGFTTSTVSLAMNGSPRALTKNFLRRVCDVFRTINYDWLQTGQGDMLVGDITPSVSISHSAGVLPVITIKTIGDFINGITDSSEKVVVPRFSNAGAEFLVSVSDSSMSPRFIAGDLLACRKVVGMSFFQWGRTYVIDTYSQGGMIKKVVYCEEDDNFIICKSENKDYGDFKLPKSEIRSLSIVIGLIRVE